MSDPSIPSVRLLPRFLPLHATRRPKSGTNRPHWLHFKKGDFRKSTAFKNYGVKTKRTSQYANEHGLPGPDSARFEHGGGSRSNTKGEYVVLVCQKHYLPT